MMRASAPASGGIRQRSIEKCTILCSCKAQFLQLNCNSFNSLFAPDSPNFKSQGRFKYQQRCTRFFPWSKNGLRNPHVSNNFATRLKIPLLEKLGMSSATFPRAFINIWKSSWAISKFSCGWAGESLRPNNSVSVNNISSSDISYSLSFVWSFQNGVLKKFKYNLSAFLAQIFPRTLHCGLSSIMFSWSSMNLKDSLQFVLYLCVSSPAEWSIICVWRTFSLSSWAELLPTKISSMYACVLRFFAICATTLLLLL